MYLSNQTNSKLINQKHKILGFGFSLILYSSWINKLTFQKERILCVPNDRGQFKLGWVLLKLKEEV